MYVSVPCNFAYFLLQGFVEFVVNNPHQGESFQMTHMILLVPIELYGTPDVSFVLQTLSYSVFNHLFWKLCSSMTCEYAG